MALIISKESAKSITGFLDETRPITYDEFETMKTAYRGHNKKIGDRKDVDLSKEPVKVYFDKKSLQLILNDIIDQQIGFITFMFTCDKFSNKHKGLRLMLCGSDKPGNLTSETIFESYPSKGKAKDPIDKKTYVDNKNLFVKRLHFYADKTNWQGVLHDNASLINAWLKDPNIYRVAMYFGVRESKNEESHYDVIFAGSSIDFIDMVPIHDKDDQYQILDNGTQCCQS